MKPDREEDALRTSLRTNLFFLRIRLRARRQKARFTLPLMFHLTARWRDDRVLLTLCALAFLISLVFNAALLPGFGPDEPRHFAYLKLLWEEHSLPRILSTQPYSEYRGAHAFHPPLYYLVLLPFYALSRSLSDGNAIHFLRFWSGLMCVAALPLLYDVALVASGERKNVARASVGTVALVPMFALTSGTLNNDAGAFFLSSLFLWLLFWKWRGQFDLKKAALLGLVLGLGGLTKATALAVGAVALLVCAGVWAKNGAPKGKVALFALVTLLVGLVVVSPWHIRSMMLYGTWTPLPESAPWGQLPPPAAGKLLMALHPNFPGVFAQSNFSLFYSLWGQRDWLWQRDAHFAGFPPPLQSLQLGIYLLLGALCLASLAGTFVARKHAKAGVENQGAFFGCLAAFGALWLSVLQVALFWHQGWAEGGRYLFPALIGFALLLCCGWERLLGRRFGVFGRGWLGALLALDALCLLWLLVYLNPTYGPK